TPRAGGEPWSGDASFGYQNKDLAAQDSLSGARNFAKPDYTRYLASFSAGGPLIKDKLFFFGSYEGNYQNRDAQVSVTPNGLPPTGACPALASVNLPRYSAQFASRFRKTL